MTLKLASALVLVTTLLLPACGKPSLPGAGPDEPKGGPTAGGKMDGSIGTIGGGGTLIFSFRHAALLAKNLMESNTDIKLAGPVNEKLNEFYVSHRASWIENLKNLAEKKEIVFESNERLREHGVEVGALAIPEGAPTRVVLSAPYLTVKDGFTEAKAIGLAIHEAGHLTAPGISAADHPMFDQVAVALTWKRSPNPIGTREKRIVRPRDARFWLPVAVTSDGMKLIQSVGDEGCCTNGFSVLQLETGWEEKMVSPLSGNHPFKTGYLGEDWIKLATDETHYRVKNLVTNQTLSVDMNFCFRSKESIADGQFEMWVASAKLYIACRDSIQIHDLNAATKKDLALPRNSSPPITASQFSPDFKTAARQESDGSFSFFEIDSGRILDFARTGFWMSDARFISDRLVLLTSPAKVDPKAWPFDANLQHWLFDVGSSKLQKVEGGDYVGKNGTTLFFMDKDRKALIRYDSTLRKVTDTRKLDEKEMMRVKYAGLGELFLVEPYNLSSSPVPVDSYRPISQFDFKTGSFTKLSPPEEREGTLNYTMTALGPVLLSESSWWRHEHAAVIRWLR